MFNSLKKQNRICLRDGSTLLVKAQDTGRKQEAVSDPKELMAIARAVQHGDPLFICQHANGTVFDVMVNETTAKNYRNAKVDQTPNGYLNVKLYKQFAGQLIPL